MRTQIFVPLPAGLNILDINTHKDHIKFVYDDEAALQDGRLRYWAWHTKLNEAITYGSRIIYTNKVADGNWNNRKSRLDDRFDRDEKSYHYPKKPQEGIYTAEKYTNTTWKYKMTPNPDYNPNKGYSYNNQEEIYAKDDNCREIKEYTYTDYLAIKYNPGGEVINYWDAYDSGHERKNNISYKIFKEDKNVLNYDLIDLDDVEFYINSRIDRKDYLEMLPVLWAIKRLRLKELKWEKEFVRMIEEEMIREGNKNDNIEQLIWECIEWWKNKVTWKRPITQDDEKALRMIKKRITKQLLITSKK